MKPLPDKILEAMSTDLLWFDVNIEDIRVAWNKAGGDEQVQELLTYTYGDGFGTRQWFIDGATEAIVRHWGQRCETFDESCACCAAWKQFDDFTAGGN